MNTTIEQFDKIEEVLLSQVEGGDKGAECLKGFGAGVGLGIVGGVATMGPIGAIPGYFVGVYAGTAYCVARAIG